MASLALKALHKRYGDIHIVRGIDLEIEAGEFIVFVGPSGCGKSTVLRMIAGLEDISSGELRIGGHEVTHAEPSERGVAMVFQSYALYPHMTVYENMAFGLRLGKMHKQEIRERVEKTAEILQLTHLLDRLPKNLSGGQRQRVAMGRAIVRQPKVFLFDEPLSNLDASLRVQMRIEIARLHADTRTTMIYVTHDQVEAMTLADRIVVLNAGRIEQVGAPLELYHRPASLFVARFIGSPKMNLLTVQELSDRPGLALRLPNGSVLEWSDAAKPAHTSATARAADATAHLGIRPEQVECIPPGEAPLTGTVVLQERLGNETFVHLDLGPGFEDLLVVRLAADQEVIRGARLGLRLPLQALHRFTAEGMRIAVPAGSPSPSVSP